MRTKTADRIRIPREAKTLQPQGPTFPDTVAYWLEDDSGNRISKLYSASDKPLKLAGRALESMGALDGWTVSRRDIDGVRHVVASGSDLEELARPFMPERTPAEAAVVGRFNRARRATGFRRPDIETDERVY
jgi:hypothetical protein